MLRDILYWTTYPFRRLVAWARHSSGYCRSWCAHCLSEATKKYYDNLTPEEIEEDRKWGEFSESQMAQREWDKIVWVLGEPEPITWDEYCLRIQKELDKQSEV